MTITPQGLPHTTLLWRPKAEKLWVVIYTFSPAYIVTLLYNLACGMILVLSNKS